MIKKIIMILIFSLIGVFILGALSYKGKFSNFDEAFLFIEGNQDIFISVDEYKKTLRLLESGNGEISLLRKMKNLELSPLKDMNA